MFCMNCGVALPEGAAFCPKCGSRTGTPNGTPPESCTACGSRSLKRVRRGEYLCEHCGSRYYVNSEDGIESEEEADAKLTALFVEAAEYEARDDVPAELQILQKGLDIAPQNVTLLLKLGRSYWRLGQNRKAMEFFERAEVSDPGNPIISIGLGNIYLTQGLYAEAKSFYEKGLAVMEANPLLVTANDLAVSYGNYGNCLGKLGDRKGAKKYLSIAKKKGYNPESLANVCRQLGLNPRWL